MAGGWWYLWTDGGVGVWGLVARACWQVSVRCLWCSCVQCRCRALWMVCGIGEGSRVGLYVAGLGLTVGRTGV